MSTESTLLDVNLRVNGRARRARIEARTSLSDVLRDEFLLTGTHVGCEHGVCGACTVLVNDEPVRACIMLAATAEGRAVTTIEGLAGPQVHALREAFAVEHGRQCGFCTPAMLIVAVDLLKRNPRPTQAEIRHEMHGNLCRCTGYMGIVKAVARAAETLAGAPDQPARVP